MNETAEGTISFALGAMIITFLVLDAFYPYMGTFAIKIARQMGSVLA